MNIPMHFSIQESGRYNVFCQYSKEVTDKADDAKCYFSDTTYSRRAAKVIMEIHYSEIHGRNYTNEGLEENEEVRSLD